MKQEIRQQAQPYDGQVPEDWELVGITESRTNRFRYYRTLRGKYYFTCQSLKRIREPKIDIREEDGYTFASRRWKRRMYEGW